MKEKNDSARQGKIARLPATIREEINLRLLDGHAGSKILPWLNALPEVITILEEDAEGLLVSDANLSNWRHGGYADWLARRERLSRTKDLADYSIKISEASGGNLTKGGAAILSGQILEFLEDLTSDRPDNAFKQDPAKVAQALSTIGETLGGLRTGDQNDVRLKQNDERLEIMRARLAQTEADLKLSREKFEFDAAKACLKVIPQLKSIASDNSLDENAKIDHARQLLFGTVAE